jgi:polyadenylate-binding protein
MASNSSSSTPYASASLYVADLSADVTEALLFEIFNAVGPVASVRVCRDATTRRSLGYAYVNFHRVEDAERALDTMNFKNIRGRPCRLMWSHRDPSLRKSGLGNIFVKNLAKSIDNKTLYDTFSMFGNILSCKVSTDRKGQSYGYGFVHYESEESAQNAIARVDGKVIAGQTVSVTQFKSRKERGGNKTKFTNLYVKNLPESFTLANLEELFSKYGTITSSKLALDKDEKFRGFAFVNYKTPEEANAAVEGLKDVVMDEKKLFVGRHQKKEERERELRDKFEQKKFERQKQYAGVNLYIKNLSDEVTDERLLQEFQKFGHISNAKVMTDAVTGKSRGFGFVCFSSPDEATKAVTEMNGRMLDNKPLYVALAQRKDVRRAQLEAQYSARVKLGVPPPQMMPPQGTLFYQGMPRMIYPQQMIPRPARWNPQTPQMMPVRGMNTYLMPVTSTGPRPRGGGRGGRGGGRGQPKMGDPTMGGRGRGQVQGQTPGGPAQQVKYTPNVRNQPLGLQASSQTPSEPSSTTTEPLTIKALAAAPEEQKKQMIGESLFPLIKEQQPELAGKITGMLLEMDNGELLHLLESREALNEKIEEALQVLQQHDNEEEEEEEEES